MAVPVSILLWLFAYVVKVYSVPPDVCFENFRWQDCGKPPTPVIYYYKSGSRCEVGMWRGCYPNPNMFQDEYECVQTCIFSARAGAQDFHNQNAIEHDQAHVDTTPEMTTIATTAITGDGTDVPDANEAPEGPQEETAPEGGEAPEGEQPPNDAPDGAAEGGDQPAAEGGGDEAQPEGGEPNAEQPEAEGRKHRKKLI